MRMFAMLALTALAAAGCTTATPEQRERDRAAIIAALFPDKADQAGIHSVFGVEAYGYYSTLEIIYFADEATDEEIKARVDRYCGRYKASGATDISYPRRPPQDVEVTLAGGVTRSARQVWRSCVAP